MSKSKGGGLKNALAPKEEQPEHPQDYEIKDAVSTLERAEEIKKDKRLMPHVHKHIGKKITSLKDLRSLANAAHLPDDEDGEDAKVEAKEFKSNIKA